MSSNKVRCGKCDGSGKKFTSVRRGYDSTKYCKDCRGTGRDPKDKLIQHMACNGTGRIKDYAVRKLNPFEIDLENLCSQCKGKGFIMV